MHSVRVNDRKLIKMKTITENMVGACVCSITRVQLTSTTCNSIVFERSSLDSQKRIRRVVWTPIDQRVFSENENALFCKCCDMKSAHHLHGNFGGNFPSNGPSMFFGNENRNGIELYHLQNTGKVFALSGHEAWH